MIKLRELKELIINNEIEFIEQVQHLENPKMYIDGLKDEINFCDTIDDIVLFYEKHGYGSPMSKIINLLMENTSLNK